MKSLTNHKIEMYMDYIKLYNPYNSINVIDDMLFVDRNYINRMITLTKTDYDDVCSFLICYYSVKEDQIIKDLETYWL